MSLVNSSIQVLQPALRLGRLTGLIGYIPDHKESLTAEKESEKNSRRLKETGSKMFTLLMIILTGISAVFKALQDYPLPTAFHRISRLTAMLFHSNLLFIYLIFYNKRSNLIDLLKQWKDCINNSHFLHGHVNTIKLVFFVMATGFLENILHDCICIFHGKRGNSILERYFLAKAFHFENFYHPLIAALYIFMDKLSLYSWNISDLLIMGFCKGISASFKELNNACKSFGHSSITPRRDKKSTNTQDEVDIFMNKLTEDYFSLRRLTHSINEFLSPLLLACFAIHLIFLSIHTNRWFLASGYNRTSLLVTSYVWISCLQYSGRMFLVVFYAADLSHQNSQLLLILQDKFKSQGKELHNFVSSMPIGIDVYGIFVITRGMYASILSFLFSFQIVLLQSNPINQPQDFSCEDHNCSF